MIVSLEELVKQSYAVIGRGQKLRPEQMTDALTALTIMFKSWSNKGRDLWRVSKHEMPLRINMETTHEGKRYLCIRTHFSEDATNPSIDTGHWLEIPADAPEITTTNDWMSGLSYGNQMYFNVLQENVFTVGNVRVYEGAQKKKFRLYNHEKFDSRVQYEIGTPSYGKVIPKDRATGLVRVDINAFPANHDVTISLDLILHADFGTGIELMPENWLSAIKYGLAVELGYSNSIDPTTLTSIVNKFQYEFRKARGSEREVESSCFVEPLF